MATPTKTTPHKINAIETTISKMRVGCGTRRREKNLKSDERQQETGAFRGDRDGGEGDHEKAGVDEQGGLRIRVVQMHGAKHAQFLDEEHAQTVDQEDEEHRRLQ